MTKQQLKAQLMSAREQAEMNMPSVLPCFDELIQDMVEDFDEANEIKQSAITLAVQSWLEFVHENGESPKFEKRIQEFRKTIKGKHQERTPRDTTLLAYATMYAINFAGSVCSIEGGTNVLSEESTPEEIAVVVTGVLRLLRTKAKTAKYFLQSLGINSPQEAIIQLEWLEEVVANKAHEAGMNIAFADIENGEIWGKKNED